jgi:hypothetical protein
LIGPALLLLGFLCPPALATDYGPNLADQSRVESSGDESGFGANNLADHTTSAWISADTTSGLGDVWFDIYFEESQKLVWVNLIQGSNNWVSSIRVEAFDSGSSVPHTVGFFDVEAGPNLFMIEDTHPHIRYRFLSAGPSHDDIPGLGQRWLIAEVEAYAPLHEDDNSRFLGLTASQAQGLLVSLDSLSNVFVYGLLGLLPVRLIGRLWWRR